MPPVNVRPGPSRVTPEKIDTAVARIVGAAHPSRIIVFGSAAHGDMHRDSDLDLLVVMSEPVPYWRRESARLREIVGDVDMPVDILVISEAEAAAAVGNRYGVLGPALREGRLVYPATNVGNPSGAS